MSQNIKQKPSNRKGSTSYHDQDVVMATVVTAMPMSEGEDSHASHHSHDEQEIDEKSQYKTKRKPSAAKLSVGSQSNSNAKIAVLDRRPSVSTNGKATPTIHAPHKDINIKIWPPALREAIVASMKRPPNEAEGLKFLTKHGWPTGLATLIAKSCKKIALRFFIVDDSGSMITNDGKRVVHSATNYKMVKCTRWSELSESLLFLADISDAFGVPSEFRLLNGADPVIVGLDSDKDSMNFLQEVMSESPAGQTPLCTHIKSVVAAVESIADDLRANGQKAAVIITTDGESTDGDVAEALAPLSNLPVLVILRLCTEEKEVIDYWNHIDGQLEFDLDVLDDLVGDARQVQTHNAWLTYGEAVHLVREFGASMKELDVIDESTLSSEQMRIIASYLFLGGNPRDLPHPGADWSTFRAKINDLNKSSPKIFDSLSDSMKPWIDMKQLDKIFAAENGSSASKGGGRCIVS